jgi:5-methyltetrahydrofolate--homocysteine methyltransferase
MATGIQFTDADRVRSRAAWSDFWAGKLDRPILWLIRKEVPEGTELPPLPRFMGQVPLGMPADELIGRCEAHLACERYYGDAMPKIWINFGPGIMAGFLGGRVVRDERTIWFEPADPESPAPVTDLRPAYDPDNVWWRRVRELTAVAARRWNGRVLVGHTDLGGNLDILASLRTTEGLLTDLVDHPEHVDRSIAEITRLWLRYYDELTEVLAPTEQGTTPWAPIWSPGRTYMLQCDFSCMISEEMFARWVMPDLTACCDRLDHAFYHLDGPGALRHLDPLLSIERLRGIQWIPGAGAAPADEWPEVRGRIRQAGKLCQINVSAEGARKVIREHGGAGFALGIRESLTHEQAEALVAELCR